MKKRVLALATLIALLGIVAVRADDPDDAYVDFYAVLQQADKLSTNGSPREAFMRYQQAEVALRTLQRNHPDYNRQLVEYREAYLDRRLEQMAHQTTNKTASANKPAPAQPQTVANPPKANK